MITEQEAIERAWDLIRLKQLPVRSVRSVNVDTAPDFLPEWTSRGDVWYVVFDRDVPADRVISPDIYVIAVDRDTGRTMVIKML
jgi:hypothetical protein